MEFTMIQWPKGVGGAVYLLVLPPSQVQELLEEIKRKQREKEITPDQATAMRSVRAASDRVRFWLVSAAADS